MALRGIIREEASKFLELTTFHALPQIPSSTKWKRIFWILLFFGLLCYWLYDAIIVISRYRSYPVHEIIEKINPPSLDFPAVTICNTNMFRRSQMSRDLLQKVENDFNFARQTKDLQDSREHVISNLFHNLTLREIINITQPKETLFMEHYKSCKFDGKPCNFKEDFDMTIVESNQGVCYTFNEKGTKKCIDSGPKNGLIMQMFINTSDYLSEASSSYGSGVFINVHPHNVKAFPSTKNVFISMGTAGHIAMEEVDVARLPSPYPSNCTSSTKGLLYSGAYTMDSCKSSCIKEKIYKQCNKTDIFSHFHFNGNMDKITPFDDVKDACEERATQHNVSWKYLCNCNLACKETIFYKTVSASVWPSVNEIPYIWPQIKPVVNIDKANVTIAYIREHFLQLSVYYPDLTYILMKEKEDLTFLNVVIQMGGISGLLTGASIITFCEVSMLLFTIVSNCLKSFLCDQSKSDVNQNKILHLPVHHYENSDVSEDKDTNEVTPDDTKNKDVMIDRSQNLQA